MDPGNLWRLHDVAASDEAVRGARLALVLAGGFLTIASAVITNYWIAVREKRLGKIEDDLAFRDHSLSFILQYLNKSGSGVTTAQLFLALIQTRSPSDAALAEIERLERLMEDRYLGLEEPSKDDASDLIGSEPIRWEQLVLLSLLKCTRPSLLIRQRYISAAVGEILQSLTDRWAAAYGDPPDVSQVERWFRLGESAKELDTKAFDELSSINSELQMRAINRYNTRGEEREELRRERDSIVRGSDRIRYAGSSLQILGLVTVLLKDLIGT